MSKTNKGPLLRAVASDAKRFLGLRTDIRELINLIRELVNLSRPPSDMQYIFKILRHPVLAQLYRESASNGKGGKL